VSKTLDAPSSRRGGTYFKDNIKLNTIIIVPVGGLMERDVVSTFFRKGTNNIFFQGENQFFSMIF